MCDILGVERLSFFMNKFYLFSKKSCGPCALVDKYFNSIKQDTSIIEKVDLEDFGKEHVGGMNITQNIRRCLEKYAHDS